MINLDACVICGSPESLNTSMTIDVDGEKVTVKICDADADTATPKLVKGHYLSKKLEIEEIIARAKALGLEVNLPDAPDVIATVYKKPEPVATRVDPTMPALDSAIADAVRGTKEEGVLSTRVVDGVSQRIQSVVGGESGVEAHAAYVPGSGADKLDPILLEGKVKMGAAEGRGGQPIAIPAVRVDQTGTTTVRVRQDMDDGALQRRFKELAGSMGADGANKHSFAASGYDVHNCPICKGDGTIKQRGKLDTCPKCKGSGLLNS